MNPPLSLILGKKAGIIMIENGEERKLTLYCFRSCGNQDEFLHDVHGKRSTMEVKWRSGCPSNEKPDTMMKHLIKELEKKK